MQISQEFQEGKHNIGWLSPSFHARFPSTEFEQKPLGTFKTLTRAMTIASMLSEGLATECEFGDVIAFLDNPPEGTKDGYSNIFIIKGASFVVSVDWDGGEWDVSAWERDDDGWYAGSRVFSPATGAATLAASPSSSLALDQAIEMVKAAGYQVSKIL